MKTNLYIFGDSFSSNHEDPNCWVNVLSQEFKIINFSQRGISEYRIWKNYTTNKSNILADSKVLFCHTNPYRIYLKDSYATLSRKLKSHTSCDIILEDIYSKKEKKLTEAVELIWDEEYLEDQYNLLSKDLLQIPKSFHVTFFEIEQNFLNLNLMWQKYSGTINHLSVEGNRLVADKIVNLIRGE